MNNKGKISNGVKKIIAYYAIGGFILNFVWEISQAGLYKPHFEGISEFVTVHLKATLGDVVMLLIIYLIASLVRNDRHWIEKNKISSYIFVAFLGFIFAIVIEKYALLTGRWGYNELMPIIPFIKVGLAPVLQLTIIAPLSVFLAVKLASK